MKQGFMKRGLVFTIIFALMISFSGCQKLNDEKKKSRSVVSYDYKYKIDTPDDWQVPEKKGAMNPVASIEAFCEKRNLYISVITEEIGSDYLGFENFCTLALRNMNTAYCTDFDKSDLEDMELCGKPAKYVEMKDIDNPAKLGEKMRMWYYLVEIDGCFAQFCGWTAEKLGDRNKAEIEMIINTFAVFEIGEKNNGEL